MLKKLFKGKEEGDDSSSPNTQEKPTRQELLCVRGPPKCTLNSTSASGQQTKCSTRPRATGMQQKRCPVVRDSPAWPQSFPPPDPIARGTQSCTGLRVCSRALASDGLESESQLYHFRAWGLELRTLTSIGLGRLLCQMGWFLGTYYLCERRAWAKRKRSVRGSPCY